MNYLLDTCVISELVAKRSNPQVVQWVDKADEERLYLSAITIGEIKRGVAKLPESRRKNQLSEWLEYDLLIRFQDRILPIDTPVMLVWGELVVRTGRSLPVMDSLIAATAQHGNLKLVTRNEKDFAGMGVEIFNPWS